ncbi:hypothetical protein [Streptomyces erythrochromogenes]|uniref:hypothetical protein n=1 Tax=Streptomyces erythrochromogenes TaxID=285574 RepID=UPI0033FB2145
MPSATTPDINDDDQYAGSLRQEISYDGSTPLTVTMADPWSRETAKQSTPNGNTKAHYVRPATGCGDIRRT